MFKKIIPILPQIIASLFLTGFMVLAWTGPTNTPPNDNVPAPVNVGSIGQSKAGWLATLKSVFIGSAPSSDEQNTTGYLRTTGGALLNTGGAENGLIIDNGYLKINGAGKGIIFPDGTILRTAFGLGRQIFTSSGNFVVPANITKVWVTVVGGGAGGGGGGAGMPENGKSGYGGGGGGAGEVKMSWVDVLPNSSIPITVGQGGVGGTGGWIQLDCIGVHCNCLAGGINGYAGLSGGQSSFGSFVISGRGTGGGGGGSEMCSNTPGVGGQIGGGSGGSPTGYGLSFGGVGGTGGTGYMVYGNGGSGGTGGNDSGTFTPSTSGNSGSGGVVILEW